MPITKSAKKALRQSARKRALNQVWKEKVRTAVRQVEKLASAKSESKKNDALQGALRDAYQAIDKAAKNHIFHKNRAARMKSRLAKLVAKPK